MREAEVLDAKLRTNWQLLRWTYGLVPIIAGLDKFTNLLTDWPKYLSPLVANVVPAGAFMHVVGVIEIIAGLIVLSRWTRIGAYIVTAWLLAIAVNLITAGYFDIAVRDVVMAVGSLSLARLTRAQETETRARTPQIPPRTRVPA